MLNRKVSIIIPIYNAEMYLKQCLDSIISQSFHDWECILVDDGSVDCCGDICDEYAKKDKRFVVFHLKNGGSSAAREYGYKKAKGEFLFFVDADDWLDENSIESQYNYMAKTKADFCISPYFIYNNNENIFCENKPSAFDKYTYVKELFGRNNLHGGLWCKFIRKELMERCSIHFPRYNYYEDMYVTISISMESNLIGYHSVPTYHYRVNENSLTFSSNPSLRFHNFKELVENMRTAFCKYNLFEKLDIVYSFYGDLNNNKLRLLELPYVFRDQMDDALDVFPESYKAEPVVGKLYLLRILALRFKIILPLHIILLIKKYLK